MTDIEKNVLYMKVTDALRSPDHKKLAELATTYNIADFPNLLYLAVELSPLDTVRWVCHLYESRKRDMNEQLPRNGNTALHVAVQSDRVPIVRHLMSLANIDDTIKNNDGLTAIDLAPTSEMETVLSAAQNKFTERLSLKLKTAFQQRDLAELRAIYANPRVSELTDINGIDPSTGRTVLHDAALANDLKLVQFILSHDGDPLIKDRKTKRLAQEYTTNEEIKRLLITAGKSKVILEQTTKDNQEGLPQSPRMEGYLKKWTNITSGYKLRWFVLENGTLSYYKGPSDVKHADNLIRGTIGLRHAIVRLDSSEKNKFEIKTPSLRFHLKAAHHADCNKWVWTLQNAITMQRDKDKQAAKAAKEHRANASSHVSAQNQHISPQGGSQGGNEGVQTSARTSTDGGHSTHTTDTHTDAHPDSDSLKSPTNRSRSGSTNEHDFFENDLNVKDDYDSDQYDEDAESDELVLRGPRITAESLVARLSAIKELLSLLSHQQMEDGLKEAIVTAVGSVDVLSSDIVMAHRQNTASEHKIEHELELSERAQKSWAATFRDLEIQYEKLEGQYMAYRKHDGVHDHDEEDEFFDTIEKNDLSDNNGDVSDSVDTSANGTGDANVNADTDDEFKDPPTDAVSKVNINPQENVTESESATAGEPSTGSANSGEPAAATESGEFGQPAAGTKTPGKPATQEVHEGIPPNPTDKQETVYKTLLDQHSFNGYEDPPRTKLSIDADNRPKLSLWSILKNLIGKDMTKMTLPVSFNECTSLLQRSAEDMEYVDLLDRAAECIDDEGLRMCYIAAFAGSSYSSTINRVAKPFNPLLGETYEYCRPDQGFRMFAEQVSHHPPIGALMAESPRWDFYGKSNVESKFYGRSFDINPLGLWYLNLRPDKGCAIKEELYSFRKITSSVVGIMLGNPVVDNYGPMHIQNHTTGVHAEINYKARGWRGSSAYKLEGSIFDKQGNVLWTMIGRWNDKMYAIKPNTNEKILLWQAHPRHKTPFNLTDFAITLNALPEKLKPWLPPTDTRLRPDQRAMEEGRYDEASDEKSRVEEKQRAARREREAKNIKYKPQWFTIEKHPVTGLEYYKPINNYWGLRAEQKLGDKGDIF